jgi:HK97 family phage prohead protease
VSEVVCGAVIHSGNRYLFKASDESLDGHNDRIVMSGMDVDRFNSYGVILYEHSRDLLPIGKGRAVVEGKEMFCEIMFDPKDRLAMEVKEMIDSGKIRHVSIGFAVYGMRPNAEGGNDFTEAVLTEISLVKKPANQNAVLLARPEVLQ